MCGFVDGTWIPGDLAGLMLGLHVRSVQRYAKHLGLPRHRRRVGNRLLPIRVYLLPELAAIREARLNAVKRNLLS
jgi:hypothetical protein